MRRLQALGERRHLDRVRLEAVAGEKRRISRHEREPADASAEREGRRRRRDGEGDTSEHRLVQPPVGVARRSEREPLVAQRREIEIGDRRGTSRRETLGFGQHLAVLEDRGLAVPGDVGRALAFAGRGVQVGRDAAGGLRTTKQRALVRLADRDVRRRKVDEHGRAGERRERGRRHRNPDVLADLGMHREVRQVGRLEHEVGAERRVGGADADRLAGDPGARREMPRLVEFPIVRQMRLRHDAEHGAAVDRERAVEQPIAVAERRAHEHERQEVPRAGGDPIDRGLHRVEQHRLEPEILDRVAGNAELRKHRDRHPVAIERPERVEDRSGVPLRIAERHGHRDGGRADEAMAVGRAEGKLHRLILADPRAVDLPARPPRGGAHMMTSWNTGPILAAPAPPKEGTPVNRGGGTKVSRPVYKHSSALVAPLSIRPSGGRETSPPPSAAGAAGSATEGTHVPLFSGLSIWSAAPSSSRPGTAFRRPEAARGVDPVKRAAPRAGAASPGQQSAIARSGGSRQAIPRRRLEVLPRTRFTPTPPPRGHSTEASPRTLADCMSSGQGTGARSASAGAGGGSAAATGSPLFRRRRTTSVEAANAETARNLAVRLNAVNRAMLASHRLQRRAQDGESAAAAAAEQDEVLANLLIAQNQIRLLLEQFEVILALVGDQE